MLTCKDLVKGSSEYIDGEMNVIQKIRYRFHLFICEDCCLYMQKLGLIIKMIKTQPHTQVDDKIIDEVVEQVKRKNEHDNPIS